MFEVMRRSLRPDLLVALALLVPMAASGAPPAASVVTPLEVPAEYATPPFDVPRSLTVPPNFRISLLTRVDGARFMAVAPNGDLFVSHPGSGTVKRVVTNPDGTVAVSNYASGLRRPHDIVFHTIGTETFVYVAESHQITRFGYVSGDATAGTGQVVVANLPDSSSPELNGAYGHQLKNIAIDRAHNLYVSIASVTNASASDAYSDPVRCAIYRYDYRAEAPADTPYGPGQLLARGLRNAEGLAFVPGTEDLWVVVNNRDNIPYPHHGDITGDGVDDYGRVIQSYVDDHPPDEFIRIRDGANYGWPFANPNPDTAAGLDDMPFDPDYNNNRDWSVFPETVFTRVDKGIPAHSAPLGLSFLQGSGVPEEYRDGAVVALRGSWNRTLKTGYKVIYFPWDSIAGKPGQQMDLVKGWLDDTTQVAWGRPVDVIPDLSGNLLISDATAGAIYKLTYVPEPPPPPPPPPEDEEFTVRSFSLVDSLVGLDLPGYEALPGGTLTIDQAQLPLLYALRANTGSAVRSVVFSYNDTAAYRTENIRPFCIAGDAQRKCHPWRDGMQLGNHVVTATPYRLAGGLGEAGRPVTLTVQVVATQALGDVASFALFDVRSGLDVPGYGAITSPELTVARSALPERYSLRANIEGEVGSLLYSYSIWPNYQVENRAPYCIRRLDASASAPCSAWWRGMERGTHTVTATPYREPNARGLAGPGHRLILHVQ